MEKNIMEKKTYSKPCVEFVDFSYTSPVIKLKGEWKKQQQK